MFRKVVSVKPSAWLLLGLAVIVSVGPRFVWQLGLVSSSGALYIVQPVLAVAAALVTRVVLQGQRDRIRHTTDKAMTILSVLSIWFVVYFLSGMLVTFVHNAVASSLQNIVINLLAFGVSAAAVEYVRHGLMLQAGRRNALWFGVIVSLVLTVQQLALIQQLTSGDGSAIEVIKFIFTFVVPALVGNFLLTYLTLVAGLSSQLVYSLGIVALTVLPPIIPKYDWYMTSMSSVLLAVATYVMIDRSRGESDDARVRRRRHRPKFAFDLMFGMFMVTLVLFMTGVFTYKPVVIMSDSMVPVFSRGSVVVVQKLRDPVDIRVGDIIQYVSENKTITHRVVAIATADDDSGDLVFTTKGDNSPSRDLPVKQEQVLGVIRSTIPYVGFPTVWLHDISQKR